MFGKILFVLIGVTAFFPAFSETNVHVERVDLERKLGTFVLPLYFYSSGYISKEVWRSPGGIACSLSFFRGKKSQKGQFTCNSKDGYKAQVVVDCDENRNRDTATYMYFGKPVSDSEVGNFYVWCE